MLPALRLNLHQQKLVGVNQRQLRLTPFPKGKPKSAHGGGGCVWEPPLYSLTAEGGS